METDDSELNSTQPVFDLDCSALEPFTMIDESTGREELIRNLDEMDAFLQTVVMIKEPEDKIEENPKSKQVCLCVNIY